jgi:hypothetical protein
MSEFTFFVDKLQEYSCFESVTGSGAGGSAQYKIYVPIFSDRQLTYRVGTMGIVKNVTVYKSPSDYDYATGAIYDYHAEIFGNTNILSFNEILGQGMGVDVAGKPANTEQAGTYLCPVDGSTSSGMFLNASGVVTKIKDSTNIRSYNVRLAQMIPILIPTAP